MYPRELREKAQEMRRQGHTHAEIASCLGASKRAVEHWTRGVAAPSVEAACNHCGQAVIAKARNRLGYACSDECRRELKLASQRRDRVVHAEKRRAAAKVRARRRAERLGPSPPKPPRKERCRRCGGEFFTKASRAVYCGAECWRESEREHRRQAYYADHVASKSAARERSRRAYAEDPEPFKERRRRAWRENPQRERDRVWASSIKMRYGANLSPALRLLLEEQRQIYVDIRSAARDRVPQGA